MRLMNSEIYKIQKLFLIKLRKELYFMEIKNGKRVF